MKEQETYSIKQASEKLEIPIRTLRYLCNSGLIPHIRRNRLGHRILKEWQLNHIKTILDLKAAGFSNPELKRYTRLVRQGDSTIPERRALIETQKRQLWQDLEDTQRGIDLLERQADLLDQETLAQ